MASGRALGCFTLGTGLIRQFIAPLGCCVTPSSTTPTAKRQRVGASAECLGIRSRRKLGSCLRFPPARPLHHRTCTSAGGCFLGCALIRQGGELIFQRRRDRRRRLSLSQAQGCQMAPPRDPHRQIHPIRDRPRLHRAHYRRTCHLMRTVATMARGAMEESSRGAMEQTLPSHSG